MTTITLNYYDTNGQLALTHTFTQGAGETLAAFFDRVRAEWAAMVTEIG